MNKERLDEIINDSDYKKLAGLPYGWDKWKFGEFCVSGPVMGGGCPRIGRLIQVRLKAGVCGTDIVLVRTQDGVLRRHENQSFTGVKEEYLAELNEWYQLLEQDTENTEYTLEGGHAATGFIVTGFEDTSEDSLSFTVTTTSK